MKNIEENTINVKFDLKKILFTRKNTISDYEIILSVLNGKNELFELLMRRYNSRLYRLARGVIRHDDDALDIVQESWLKIYSCLEQFKGPEGFGAWASKITHNYCLMRLRKKQLTLIQSPIEDDAMEDKRHSAATSKPFDNLAAQQLEKLLINAIDRLPDHYRLVFLMRAVEQLSTKETAESLSMTTDAVKQRFSRSKRILREGLDTQINQSGLNLFEFAGKRCDAVVHYVLSKIGE